MERRLYVALMWDIRIAYKLPVGNREGNSHSVSMHVAVSMSTFRWKLEYLYAYLITTLSAASAEALTVLIASPFDIVPECSEGAVFLKVF
jgi:hypothetical protein